MFTLTQSELLMGRFKSWQMFNLLRIECFFVFFTAKYHVKKFAAFTSHIAVRVQYNAFISQHSPFIAIKTCRLDIPHLSLQHVPCSKCVLKETLLPDYSFQQQSSHKIYAFKVDLLPSWRQSGLSAPPPFLCWNRAYFFFFCLGIFSSFLS